MNAAAFPQLFQVTEVVFTGMCTDVFSVDFTFNHTIIMLKTTKFPFKIPMGFLMVINNYENNVIRR